MPEYARTNEKSPQLLLEAWNLIGQRPTLPHTRAHSTGLQIRAERLNFRVRDGNWWDPLATVTPGNQRRPLPRGRRIPLFHDLLIHRIWREVDFARPGNGAVVDKHPLEERTLL
jgi:hypothetical protein